MFVPKKMRINKFEQRPLVSNRLQCIGKGINLNTEWNNPSKDTSDCYSEPNTLGASTLKLLGLANDIGIKAIEHRVKEGAQPLSIDAKNK